MCWLGCPGGLSAGQEGEFMSTTGFYDSLSEDYDRFVNWPARLAFELPFFRALFAAHGVKVVGVDINLRVGIGGGPGYRFRCRHLPGQFATPRLDG